LHAAHAMELAHHRAAAEARERDVAARRTPSATPPRADARSASRAPREVPPPSSLPSCSLGRTPLGAVDQIRGAADAAGEAVAAAEQRLLQTGTGTAPSHSPPPPFPPPPILPPHSPPPRTPPPRSAVAVPSPFASGDTWTSMGGGGAAVRPSGADEWMPRAPAAKTGASLAELHTRAERADRTLAALAPSALRSPSPSPPIVGGRAAVPAPAWLEAAYPSPAWLDGAALVDGAACIEAAALVEAAREGGRRAAHAATIEADVVAERRVREAHAAMERAEALLMIKPHGSGGDRRGHQPLKVP
jgi:hypothetical protein